eukprot:CAMPEP_0113613456 /NCGR_PEP_ID=MMETSP0017_2-20120614/6646_1 /TAXON_ID=2856 /ORGANISM="Cylindrotheca closterium" /LENGTH=57 /DNA_ID=CAMNT_0000522565 /DNA_START=1 /DNA_END=170 /DNA_ORIENTATION=+ /assembly_acc=CAM_ASM_000147
MKVLSKPIYLQVLEFLKLPRYESHEMANFDPVHRTRYDDNVKMKPETRKKLEDFFRP